MRKYEQTFTWIEGGIDKRQGFVCDRFSLDLNALFLRTLSFFPEEQQHNGLGEIDLKKPTKKRVTDHIFDPAADSVEFCFWL